MSKNKLDNGIHQTVNKIKGWNSQNLNLGIGLIFTTQRVRDEIHHMQHLFNGWNSPKTSFDTFTKWPVANVIKLFTHAIYEFS